MDKSGMKIRTAVLGKEVEAKTREEALEAAACAVGAQPLIDHS
jgi:hypothetical protein